MSYLSRVQGSTLPSAVLTTRPASLSMLPLGEWWPGSHCGYSRVIGPGVAGTVVRTRKIRRSMSVASTSMRSTPWKGMSRGGAVWAWTVGKYIAANSGNDSAARIFMGLLRGSGWRAVCRCYAAGVGARMPLVMAGVGARICTAACLADSVRRAGVSPFGTRREPIHGGSLATSMSPKVPKGLTPPHARWLGLVVGGKAKAERDDLWGVRKHPKKQRPPKGGLCSINKSLVFSPSASC